ncbi:39S ribosomal protein L23, mitochondrial-like isoform X2 [Homarus americanus]|nr:39S ribosomal protein L23, mitochondrial-like isoform X2 [Homarus americanus]
MKLVKPDAPQPPNVVQFIVSMQMSKYDIENYLEKIYNVQVENVVTHVRMGKCERSFKGYITKKDDYKVAFVTLPRTEKFEFPTLFPESKQEKENEELKQLDVLQDEWNSNTRRHKHRHGVPTWFGV